MEVVIKEGLPWIQSLNRQYKLLKVHFNNFQNHLIFTVCRVPSGLVGAITVEVWFIS